MWDEFVDAWKRIQDCEESNTNLKYVDVISKEILEELFSEINVCKISEEKMLKFYRMILNIINDFSLGDNKNLEELYCKIYKEYAYDDKYSGKDEIGLAFHKGAVWGAMKVLSAAVLEYQERQKDVIRKKLFEENKELFDIIVEAGGIRINSLAEIVGMDFAELEEKMKMFYELEMCSKIQLGETALYLSCSNLSRIKEEFEANEKGGNVKSKNK